MWVDSGIESGGYAISPEDQITEAVCRTWVDGSRQVSVWVAVLGAPDGSRRVEWRWEWTVDGVEWHNSEGEPEIDVDPTEEAVRDLVERLDEPNEDDFFAAI